MKFIIMVWFAFLARHRPVSTRANPACINMTKKPVTRVQTKLMAILFCPTWFAMSLIVRPFLGSLTVTSLTFPVREPSGSPLARASAGGTGVFAKSVSIIGFGTDGVVAGAVGAAGTAGGGLE